LRKKLPRHLQKKLILFTVLWRADTTPSKEGNPAGKLMWQLKKYHKY
jgi:hypothetical protein